MGSLAILRLDDVPSAELARHSVAWTAPIATDAALLVGRPADDAVVLGAFEPATDAPGAVRLVRRGSGGARALVSPGTVWMQLRLARPDALVPCAADKLLNRYVRPLLRALTRVSSVPASYFGRDWISVAHRPAALVAFAHEAATGRSLVEAVVAVRAPFASGPRPSFLGKAPATLEEAARRALDVGEVEAAIVDAYRGLASASLDLDAATPFVAAGEPAPATAIRWTATREEALGVVAAGRDAGGRLRVGGELMASRDAVARLEDLVAALPPGAGPDEVGRVVDEALTTRGAVTFGVRSLASIRDVIVLALRA